MSKANLTPPDFEEMQEVSNNIHMLQKKKLLLEVEIEEMESSVTMEVRTNEKYFVRGKPPAMNFVEQTYLFSGINGELIPKRRELAEVTADLDRAKRRYYIMKQIVDAWRTQSANARSVSYD